MNTLLFIVSTLFHKSNGAAIRYLVKIRAHYRVYKVVYLFLNLLKMYFNVPCECRPDPSLLDLNKISCVLFVSLKRDLHGNCTPSLT